MPDADQVQSAGEPGLLLKALLRVLMRKATVSTCEDLGDRFRLITFEGPQLCGVEWVAGQKVQIAMGAWLLGLKPGDACNLLGPRTSLDVSRLSGPLALFGARFLRSSAPGQDWQGVGDDRS